MLSLTKSTVFVVPFDLVRDVQEMSGVITATTPKEFIKAMCARSQLNGWLRDNRCWCNEYYWIMSAHYL